jgi:predicted double-glycine peptidase
MRDVRSHAEVVLLILSVLAFCLTQGSTAESGETQERAVATNSCGPECLHALLRMVRGSHRECSVDDIYRLIGKTPDSPTTMRDIKNAARQLGFHVEAFKLTVADLANANQYAILPLGTQAGTADDPLHFVLVKQIVGKDAMLIDATTLATYRLPVDELRRMWNGYALLFDMSHIHSENSASSSARFRAAGEAGRQGSGSEVINFGEVDGGTEVEHTFLLPTRVGQKLDPKIVAKSCACIQAELLRDAEGRDALKVKLRVNKPSWQSVSIDVRLYPQGEVKRYTLRAYGKSTYRVSPEVGYVAIAQVGDIKYPVQIDYATDCNDVVEVDGVETKLPWLGFQHVETRKEIVGRTCRFTIRTFLTISVDKIGQDAKPIDEEITFLLRTRKGMRHVPMRLIARIAEPEGVRIAPRKLFIVTRKDSAPEPKKVLLEFLTDKVPEALSLEVDGALPVEVQSSEEDAHTYGLSVVLPREKLEVASVGLHKGTIRVAPDGAFTGTFRTAEIPVSIFVRE